MEKKFQKEKSFQDSIRHLEIDLKKDNEDKEDDKQSDLHLNDKSPFPLYLDLPPSRINDFELEKKDNNDKLLKIKNLSETGKNKDEADIQEGKNVSSNNPCYDLSEFSFNEESNLIKTFNNNDINDYLININSTKTQTPIKNYDNDNNKLLNKKREKPFSEKSPKANLFIINKSPDKEEHDEFHLDNIAKKMDCSSFTFIINKLNNELKKINILYGNSMFLHLGDKGKRNKEYYKKLMGKIFKEIIEDNISDKYDKNKININKLLIDHILGEYKKGNKQYSNIVKFLGLKCEDFWKFVSFYLKYKDKEVNQQKIVDEIYEDYRFLLEMVKELLFFFDEQVLPKLRKKENEEEYKIIFYLVLSDFHILSQEKYKNLLLE